MKRFTQYFEYLVYAAGGAYALLFLISAAMRLLYPYEVEWNEGAVFDHALRLLDGKPIYTAPSLDFAPFIYTPIYYYAMALLAKIGGEGLWVGRLISIAALTLYFNASTNGWYRFYTATIPAIKVGMGFRRMKALEFFPQVLFNQFAIFTLVTLVCLVWEWKNISRTSHFALLLLAYGAA